MTTSSQPADAPSGPQCLGRYPLIRLLGEGGAARIYLTHHPTLDIPAAIKVLRTPGDSPWANDARERFLREARLASRISHPGVVRILDVDVAGNIPFMVMEYVPGRTLSECIRDQRMDTAEILRIAHELAWTIHRAHECGVIHRDIKPSNVVIRRDGSPKLLDFGVSRLRRSSHGLTHTGELIGTPQYMAPEQIDSPVDRVDGRVDIWGLGVVLYEMLTGTNPFLGSGLFKTLKRVGTHVPAPPSTKRPGLPPSIDEFIVRALAKNPDERFSTARVMAQNLQLILRELPAAGRSTRKTRKLIDRRVGPRRRGVVLPIHLPGSAWAVLAASAVALGFALMSMSRGVDEGSLPSGALTVAATSAISRGVPALVPVDTAKGKRQAHREIGEPMAPASRPSLVSPEAHSEDLPPVQTARVHSDPGLLASVQALLTRAAGTEVDVESEVASLPDDQPEEPGVDLTSGASDVAVASPRAPQQRMDFSSLSSAGFSPVALWNGDGDESDYEDLEGR